MLYQHTHIYIQTYDEEVLFEMDPASPQMSKGESITIDGDEYTIDDVTNSISDLGQSTSFSRTYWVVKAD